MKVLVTGYQGYVGAVLLQRLVSAGIEVTGLDTLYFQDCAFLPFPSAVSVVRKDVRDVVLQDVQGVDAIIHLAALSNDPMGQLDAELTLDINYRSSVRLATLAKQAGVKRFIYASSCSLYGKSSGEQAVTEDGELCPLTAYAQSKVKTEKEVSLLADSNFCPIFLRFSTVFGISPQLRVDLVVNNLAASGITSGAIKIMSDGSPWRPLIHVEDVAAAYEFFLKVDANLVSNQSYNVGFNTQNYQVKTVAEQVAKALPGTKIVYAENADKDSRSYRVSFDKYAKLSNLKPIWDLESGTEQIVKAYRLANFSAMDLTGRKYVRLNQIKHLLESGKIDSSLRWK